MKRHPLFTLPLSPAHVRCALALAASPLLGMVPAHAQPPAYTITDLGPLPGDTSSAAVSVNNAGQVVGYSGGSHVVLWQKGANGYAPTALVTPPHDGAPADNSVAAINDAAQVVGASDAFSQNEHAVLWQPGAGGYVATDLGVVRNGTDPNEPELKRSSASGINNAGQTVGWSDVFLTPGEFAQHAALFAGGAATDLGTLPGAVDSFAESINDAGQIVGVSTTAGTSASLHAVLWQPGASGYAATDLGTLPGDTVSGAAGINNAGQVVGYSASDANVLDSVIHAVLWQPGAGGYAPTDLGTLGGPTSNAQGINDAAQVVGRSDTGGGGESAFVYMGGTMYDLNTLIPPNSGWTLSSASAVNKNGQIVGSGIYNGQSHAFLLTPAASISIVSARMTSRHFLEIKTRRDFGATPRNVQVTATINGTPVTLEQDNLTTDVDDSGAVTDTKPFDIDLAAQKVPRFTTNQHFTVTATAGQGDDQLSDTKDAVILLPVVLVPGIGPVEALLDPKQQVNGGDHTWPKLENLLESGSAAKLAKSGWLGDGYAVREQLAGYPTLFTLSYDRNTVSFAAGASALSAFLSGTVKQLTYADAVNLVAHSKGSLVSRKYVVTQPLSMGVNQLIMCGGPHYGSLMAKVDTTLGVVPGVSSVDYQNLYPLWPWMNTESALGDTSPYIYVPPFSTDLAVLNNQVLPSNIQYEIIYSSSLPTPFTYTRNLSPFGSDFLGYTHGDGIVPDFSQLGYMGNPNLGEPFLQPLIPAFRGVPMTVQEIDGFHGGYMDTPDVGAEVLGRLTQSP